MEKERLRSSVKSSITAGRSHVRRFSGVIRAAGLGVAATAIFLLGIGIGNGRIPISFYQTKPDAANAHLPSNLDYSSVEAVYDSLRSLYDGSIDQQKLLDGAKAGLAAAVGDPYTQYLSSKEAEEFDNEMRGSFSGIGAELGKDADGSLIVVSPIQGFPASKAGLRPKDIITAINDESTAGMEIYTAVNKIRGPKGTTVSLKIVRGKSENQTIKITREDITVPSVKWEVLDGNVGYITITQFGTDTSELARQAAGEIKGKGVTSVVLDLRGNPGGLLESAKDVAGIWLPKGKTIVREKRGNVVLDTAVAPGNGALEGMKTVVLVNGGSASASEIVAGALRDNNAATIIGEKSYGKGSVQQIDKLPGGSELKVTVARWFRPNGENIDKKGIIPDREVKLSEDDYTNTRDPQKDAALSFLH